MGFCSMNLKNGFKKTTTKRAPPRLRLGSVCGWESRRGLIHCNDNNGWSYQFHLSTRRNDGSITTRTFYILAGKRSPLECTGSSRSVCGGLRHQRSTLGHCRRTGAARDALRTHFKPSGMKQYYEPARISCFCNI